MSRSIDVDRVHADPVSRSRIVIGGRWAPVVVTAGAAHAILSRLSLRLSMLPGADAGGGSEGVVRQIEAGVASREALLDKMGPEPLSDERVPRRVWEMAATLVLFSISAFGPWLSVRTSEGTRRYLLFSLPVLRWALALGSALLLVSFVVGVVRSWSWPMTVPVVVATVLSALVVALLVIEEVSSSLIPRSALPTSVRRLAVDVYGGWGAWVALVALCLFITCGMVDRDKASPIDLMASAFGRAEPWQRVVVFFGVVGVALAAFSRYQPWAQATVSSEQYEVQGVALPYLGAGSAICVLVAAVLIVAVLARPSVGFALLLAFAGWLVAFFGALGVLLNRLLAEVALGDLLPDDLADAAPRSVVSRGPWMAFAGGCCVALAAGVTVRGAGREL